MSLPLVSVIVPVYKVEPYLEECILSIRNQTYTNLEIILVDDGSPDRCGEICDKHAALDARIRVIHRENGGLSVARNTGMEVATGSFISFIDSDDYIAPRFYELLLKGFEEHPGMSVVACQIYKGETGNLLPLNAGWEIRQPTVYDFYDYCERVIVGKQSAAVWNKLYRAELLREIRFRAGRVLEDTLFMFDFLSILRKNQVGLLIIPDRLYYYRVREGSICTDTRHPIMLESIRCTREIADYYRDRDDVLFKQLQRLLNRKIIFFNAQLLANRAWKQKYAATFPPLRRQVSMRLLFQDEVSTYFKLVTCLVWYFPFAYPVLRQIKRTIVGLYVRVRITRYFANLRSIFQ